MHEGTVPLAKVLLPTWFVKLPVDEFPEPELLVIVLLVGLLSLGVPSVLVAVLTLAFFYICSRN
jgi:hypothetical protein